MLTICAFGQNGRSALVAVTVEPVGSVERVNVGGACRPDRHRGVETHQLAGAGPVLTVAGSSRRPGEIERALAGGCARSLVDGGERDWTREMVGVEHDRGVVDRAPKQDLHCLLYTSPSPRD